MTPAKQELPPQQTPLSQGMQGGGMRGDSRLDTLLPLLPVTDPSCAVALSPGFQPRGDLSVTELSSATSCLSPSRELHQRSSGRNPWLKCLHDKARNGFWYRWRERKWAHHLTAADWSFHFRTQLCDCTDHGYFPQCHCVRANMRAFTCSDLPTQCCLMLTVHKRESMWPLSYLENAC